LILTVEMQSHRSLLTFSFLTLLFPFLINSQGYEFGPPPSEPNPPSYTPLNPARPPPGNYNSNPPPDSGTYATLLPKPNQYIPPPSNPGYGLPPSNPGTYSPPPNGNPNSPGNGIFPGGPVIPFPPPSSFSVSILPPQTFSAVPTVPVITVPSGGGAAMTETNGGAFSSPTNVPVNGELGRGACPNKTLVTSTRIVTQTATSVL
jgi:hypothetical protein